MVTPYTPSYKTLPQISHTFLTEIPSLPTRYLAVTLNHFCNLFSVNKQWLTEIVPLFLLAKTNPKHLIVYHIINNRGFSL